MYTHTTQNRLTKQPTPTTTSPGISPVAILIDSSCCSSCRLLLAGITCDQVLLLFEVVGFVDAVVTK